MKKLFVIYISLHRGSGAERALINMLCALSENYDIDLALRDGRGHMFDLIPKNVTVLPFLKQLEKCTPELLRELRDEGCGHIADIREFVYKRARDPEFLKLPKEEQTHKSWDDLTRMIPEYTGYDAAIAFAGAGMPLKIVLDRVEAKKKLAFLHVDMKTALLFDEAFRFTISCNYPLWEKIDHIVMLTEQNRQTFIELFPPLSSKVIVLPNINSIEYITQMSREYYPPEYGSAQFKLFSASRISEQKGVDLIFEASYMLREKGVDFRWVVAGASNGDFGVRFWENYRKSDIQDRLIVKDNMKNPFPYYKNCDLYVHPSRFEGRCLALEEALILGRPILATNYPSVTDVITDGVNGVICDISAKSIADNIIKLAENKSLRERLAANSRSSRYDTGIEKYIELLG